MFALARNLARELGRAVLHRRRLRGDEGAPASLAAARQACSAGEFERARENIESDLRWRADADCLELHGDIERAAGRFDAACADYAAAAERRGETPELLEKLGETLATCGRSGDALRAFERALAAGANRDDTEAKIGACLLELGQVQAAERMQRKVLARRPHAMALANLAAIAERSDDHAAALGHFRAAIELEPKLATLRYRCALALRHIGDLAGAREQLRSACHLDPTHRDALYLLAFVARELGDATGARANLDAYAAVEPSSARGSALLGLLAADAADCATAESAFRRALALDPNDRMPSVGLAHCLLAQGQFEAGWIAYEERFATKESPARGLALQTWRSEPLSGAGIVLYAEQGLGDELMYANCFADVIDRAGLVVIECDPRLTELYRRSFPAARILGQARRSAGSWREGLDGVRWMSAIGSLPRFLRRRVDDFPRHSGYLRADPVKVACWRKRLDALGGGQKIGLSWRGGVAQTRRALRSIPLEQLSTLIDQPDTIWVSVQYGDCGAEIDAYRRAHPHKPVQFWQQAIDDYDETAALVCALDGVVSVCTALVHLSGALGRPTLVLVPSVPEWRYQLQGERMPWYPSVQLLRQRRQGMWEDVLEAACSRLAELRQSAQGDA